MIAVNLSRQKELDANPKAIQEIEIVWQVDVNSNATCAGAHRNMFGLTVLEGIRKTGKNYVKEV